MSLDMLGAVAASSATEQGGLARGQRVTTRTENAALYPEPSSAGMTWVVVKRGSSLEATGERKGEFEGVTVPSGTKVYGEDGVTLSPYFTSPLWTKAGNLAPVFTIVDAKPPVAPEGSTVQVRPTKVEAEKTGETKPPVAGRPWVLYGLGAFAAVLGVVGFASLAKSN